MEPIVEPALIALIVIALLAIIVLAKSVTIVPQAQAKVIERLGRYSRTLPPGLSVLVPFVDRVRATIQLREVLDGTTGPWGLRVARVEIKAIDPPPSIRDSMEKQMRADRDKRAIILTAEGARQSAITTAEGQKAAGIL